MELFNYYHGLLSQQSLINAKNNGNNNNMQRYHDHYHHQQPQHELFSNTNANFLTPEFLTQLFSLLTNLNYIELFKQENLNLNQLTSSSINSTFYCPPPPPPPTNATHQQYEPLNIKTEHVFVNEFSNQTENIEFDEASLNSAYQDDEPSTTTYSPLPQTESPRHLTQQQDTSKIKKCKKLKGKESSKRYREKMRSQNLIMEKDLNDKVLLNEKLVKRIKLLMDLKEKFCNVYGQELVRLHNSTADYSWTNNNNPPHHHHPHHHSSNNDKNNTNDTSSRIKIEPQNFEENSC
jgi:hypothetical protein